MKKSVNIKFNHKVTITKSDDTSNVSESLVKEEHSELLSENSSKVIMTRWGNVGAPRQFLSTIDIPQEYFKENMQFRIVSQLYGDISFVGSSQIINQLRAKLSSYEHQDREKERTPKLEGDHFVTYPELLEMLVLSKMKCYYCKSVMRILYKEIRDMKQWTLDRIDNTDIHTCKNCRVACLECNLQKRRRDDTDFLFTKQLKIGKIER